MSIFKRIALVLAAGIALAGATTGAASAEPIDPTNSFESQGNQPVYPKVVEAPVPDPAQQAEEVYREALCKLGDVQYKLYCPEI